jgi:hypothetical protein
VRIASTCARESGIKVFLPFFGRSGSFGIAASLPASIAARRTDRTTIRTFLRRDAESPSFTSATSTLEVHAKSIAVSGQSERLGSSLLIRISS